MRSLFALFGSTELATLILTFASHIHQSRAFSFATAPSANVDISQLGRVALAGNFDGISLYQYLGQTETTGSQNGSTSLLSRYPNGAFATLQISDGIIQTMCSFVGNDGFLHGVVVGGNFTSLGGQAASGVALFNTTTAEIVPLPGLNGSVSALHCDQNSSTVYVGGSFSGGDSSNAIAWVTGWTNLPFAGFNGPVTSITKSTSGNLVFGGTFDGLGNSTAPTVKNSQVVPLSSANITAVGSSSQTGFSDPANVVCKTGATDGSGNTWLLQDATPGSWTASFRFGFNPTKLRLYNTAAQGRGTKTFRFTALPLNGILNMSYIDPTSGQLSYCDATCPLPENNSTNQDFEFVNPQIGMNSFRLDISDWYGSGGGLAGVELFQNDIYAFAVNAFNEQRCDGVSTGQAVSTTTGPWTVTPSGQSNSEYLTANLTGPISGPSQASVVFEPNIKQAGNYSITVFTPGCIGDNTCSTRGRVTITGVLSSGTGTSAAVPISTEIWQTNNYDKYDEIYVGHVDVLGSSFEPRVTLAPSSGQTGPLTVVAQKVRANLRSSTGGLNGLYEYNPNVASAQTDFTNSVIDTAGTSLDGTATVSALAASGTTIYVAGSFNASGYSNVFSIGSQAADLGEGGLNGAVRALTLNDSALFMAGSFTGTTDGTTAGLSGVAAYNLTTSKWQALGAGINGIGSYVIPLQLNLTANQPELALAISGTFTSLNAFGSNSAVLVNNFAIWVPGRGNWLQNLKISAIYLQGALTAGTTIPDNPPLFAGSVSSYALASTGTTELTGTGNALSQFSLGITATTSNTSSLTKREVISNSSSGVLAGMFYNSNGLNLTIFGGHFSAPATNGSTITNLAIINGTTNNVTGIAAGVDSASTISTLGFSGTSLFAGGQLAGTVNGRQVSGLIVYDLMAADYAATQPAALQGTAVVVNAIAPQPSSTNVYVGGSFDSAGSFDCPSLCVYDTSHSQWNTPGSGITGSVAAMSWVSATSLVIVGNLTANSNSSTVMTYDTRTQTYTSVNGPSGTLAAVTAASSDGSQYWVGGNAADGSPLLQKYNGTWGSVSPALGAGSSIRGLQVFMTTSNHATSDLLARNNVLVALGSLNVTGYGLVSAAVFNGTTWAPYALTASTATGSSTGLSQLFVSNPSNFFKSSKHHLAVGFVVLIALAIALGLIFLVVVAGILAERYRRRRDGYVPAPQSMPQDKFVGGTSRIPPEHLFGSVGPSGGGGTRI